MYDVKNISDKDTHTDQIETIPTTNIHKIIRKSFRDTPLSTPPLTYTLHVFSLVRAHPQIMAIFIQK